MWGCLIGQWGLIFHWTHTGESLKLYPLTWIPHKGQRCYKYALSLLVRTLRWQNSIPKTKFNTINILGIYKANIDIVYFVFIYFSCVLASPPPSLSYILYWYCLQFLTSCSPTKWIPCLVPPSTSWETSSIGIHLFYLYLILMMLERIVLVLVLV